MMLVLMGKVKPSRFYREAIFKRLKKVYGQENFKVQGLKV